MADTMTLEQVHEEMLPCVDGTDTHTKVPVVKMQGWADAIDAAIKQREQDKLDAARHRWLRDTQTTFGVSAQYDTAGKPIFYVRLHGFGTSADDVDAAIDAAMVEESGNV